MGSPWNMSPDPSNSSQMIVSGARVFGVACDKMNWHNDSTFTLPWGQYELYFDGKPHYFRDEIGVVYNWTMEELPNSTYGGILWMDQTHAGGPNLCQFPLNNNFKS